MDTTHPKSLSFVADAKTELKRLRIDTEGGGTRVIYSRFERRASGRSSRSLILGALLPFCHGRACTARQVRSTLRRSGWRERDPAHAIGSAILG